MHKILKTVDWLSEQGDADTTFESFLSGWFIGAKCSELKRGNMVVFLAWTMFAKEWSTTAKDERKSIMDMVGWLAVGRGRDVSLSFSLKHTLFALPSLPCGSLRFVKGEGSLARRGDTPPEKNICGTQFADWSTHPRQNFEILKINLSLIHI